MERLDFFVCKRLLAVSGFVRQGAVFADIGTDHAYLPIYLAQKGIIHRAYATDISLKAIGSAKSNVEKANLNDKIEVIRCEGLNGLENKGITDISVCGMGGELISEILKNGHDSLTSNPEINLILQPMSGFSELTAYLISEGFTITDEILAEDRNRVYRIINARYSGMIERYSQVEMLLGKINIEKKQHELIALCNSKINNLKNMLKSGENTAATKELISELEIIKKTAEVKNNEDQ